MELILTNKNGQTLDLLNNENRFVLIGCDALHGIDTDIQDVSSPYLDGTIIENVKATPRGISMTFAVLPPIRDSIDFFTSIVKSKQWVTLSETENGKEIQIKGIATIPPYTRMEALCKIQLSIYCGQPYWEDIDAVVGAISTIIPKLFFPASTGQFFTPVLGTRGGRVFGVIDLNATKTFDNDGDVSVGMHIYITAFGEITNPRISCQTGEQNGWWMQLGDEDNPLVLHDHDEVDICTIKGSKYIKINGSDEYDGKPVLSYLAFNGTDWLQLETGENTFNISPRNADAYFTINFKRRYE